MKYVDIYDPDTALKQSIPMAELSPNMLRGQLVDCSIAWVDMAKVKLQKKAVHPPLSTKHKAILQRAQCILADVFPCSLTQWENNLRCDQNLERELHVWRWIAHRFERLTATGCPSLTRKKDIFQLCLRWTWTKEPEAVLATSSLDEVTQPEAASILSNFHLTDAGFFGGLFAKCFPTAEAIDYSIIKPLDEFKALTIPAMLTLAVDWSGNYMEIVHGRSVLQSVVAEWTSREISTVAFAVDFGTDQVEHLLAAVLVAKGSYEWNGKVHHLNP
jgi:hypothetical protein